MAIKLKNPFVTEGYTAKEYFCGREEEQQEILTALSSGRSLTLYSPRRMGKTGLIHRVFEDCTDANCYYIDIMNTTCLKEFVDLLSAEIIGSLDGPVEKLFSLISRISKGLRPIITPDEISGLPSLSVSVTEGREQHTLKDIFDYLKNTDKRCYIAIDEFQQIASYPEYNVEGLLRSYIQFIPNCTFIFAGSRKHLMIEMFSSPKRPFYQSTQPLSLKSIEKDKYYEFASGMFEKGGCKLPKECFVFIYDSVYGHTWYIQYWLSKLFDNADGEIGMEDVNICLQKILLEGEDEYVTYMRLLTSAQRRVITAIAKHGKTSQPLAADFIKQYNLPAFSTVRSNIQNLVEHDLILFDANEYSVYNRFFMLWLRERK